MTIRQFDVFANPTRTRAEQPFLICVQHKDLDHLPTRLVAPLATQQVVRTASRLNPMLTVGGKEVFLVPQNLSPIALRFLREPAGSLEQDRDRIIAAVDMLMTGV
jgi:toxin CcdB